VRGGRGPNTSSDRTILDGRIDDDYWAFDAPPDDGESVRGLNPGARRPRPDASDEEEPAARAPGAAEIGARTIAGGAGAPRLRVGAARLAALGALAIVILAIVLVAVVRI
jgi:hypothetical protein